MGITIKQALRGQLVLALVVGSGFVAHAQNSKGVEPIGMPQDWSQSQLLFTNPATAEEAASQGRSKRWERLAKDPRFVLALTRKFEAQAQAKATGSSKSPAKPRPGATPPSSLQRDWSNVLGGGLNGVGGTGREGMYPAKYTFNILAAPSCTNDFVVYPTNTAGATSSGTSKQWVASFTGNPTAGQTVDIGVTAPRAVTLVASATLNTGLNFLATGDNTANATNLRDAVNRYRGQTGISATSSGAQVTITFHTAGNVSNGTISEGLSNFGGFSTSGGTNAAGQPTIIAFNQLYDGYCDPDNVVSAPGPGAARSNPLAPNVMWAHNTGTGRIAETSPVLSYYDGGRQVAFIQRNPGSNPDVLELVLLKWSEGSGSAALPTELTPVALADYRACTAPCMARIQLDGTSNTDNDATFSSPFVDYRADVLWVGDGNSRLHRFTGVFKGTPAETVGGGFPATVTTAGIKLSPPLYDFAGNVFVGSQSGSGATNGGRLHRVSAVDGTVTSSAKIAGNSSTGLTAPQILDVTSGKLYAFLVNTPGNATPGLCSTALCRSVVQFDTPTFAADATGTRALIGRGDSEDDRRYQWQGHFDNAFYTSTTRTGALYVCGTAVDNAKRPALWKIPVTGGAMGTPELGRQLVGGDIPYAEAECSPITTIKNGGREYLYVSVPSDGLNLGGTGCTGACLYMFDLSDLNGSTAGTGAAWATTNDPWAALQVYLGTTGVIVDNISTTPGNSRVYFSHLASTGNAVQATQSGLE